MKKNKDKKIISGFVKGLIGIGTTIYLGKKILDLYSQDEERSLLSKEEYEEKLSLELYKNKKDEFESSPYFFKRELITEADPVDYFFLEFLKGVEKFNETPYKIFRVSDIEKIIPYEEIRIANRSNYKHLILELLSDKRDYIKFINNPYLTKKFTEIIKKTKKDDNFLYKENYHSEEFIINPEYINEFYLV